MLHDPSSDKVIAFSACEEVEIGLEVVILDLERTESFWSRDRLEKADGLLDTVLQLQIIDKSHLILCRQRAGLLHDRGEEVVVSAAECWIEDLVSPLFADPVDSVVDHGMVLKVLREATGAVVLVNSH